MGLIGTLNAEEGGRGFYRNNEFLASNAQVSFGATDRIEALRAMVILIVWLGFTATLLGKYAPEHVPFLQWVALGARLTLLSMVVWLLLQRNRHVKRDAREEQDRLERLEAEVAALRSDILALHAALDQRDERIVALTAEAVVLRIAAKVTAESVVLRMALDAKEEKA